MSPTPSLPDDLPKWLWLFIAPAILPAILLARYLDPQFYQVWIDGELGLVEMATPLLLSGAMIAGTLIAWRSAAMPARWIGIWFLLHAAGAFYFAGEEISWGQHFLGWQTPATIAALNDQDETNLHNMSSWLDQKPRLMVVLWSIFGGAVAPLLMALGRLDIGGPLDWRYWIVPRRVCIVPGVMVALVRVPEDVAFSIGYTLPFPFDVRASEIQEMYLAMFLSFYAVSAFRRLQAMEGLKSPECDG